MNQRRRSQPCTAPGLESLWRQVTQGAHLRFFQNHHPGYVGQVEQEVLDLSEELGHTVQDDGE